ncbi:MAG: outer membrane beta-barrel protein [Boseongicola sp.]
MNSRRMVVGVLAACLMTSVAVADAADADFGANWQGFYLGLGGGYANAAKHITSPKSFSTNTDIGLVGLYTGYNRQINNVIIGIEADAYLGFGGPTPLAGLDLPSVLKSKVGGSWSVRGRLGLAYGRFMPYVSGGYAGSTSKLTFASGLVGSDSKALHGWTIGAGAEYKIHEKWRMRVDYQYQVFGAQTYFESGPAPALTQNVDIHQVTIGMARQF